MLANKTLLQMKYARIIALFAQKAHITELNALDFFYASHTYLFMSEGISNFHCLSDGYLTDELMQEFSESVRVLMKNHNQP